MPRNTDRPCYNVNSSTQLFIEDFPANSGTVDITVTTVGGTSAVDHADKYFYGATFPTVTFLSQRYGAQKGGAVLTITGTNFPAAAVSLSPMSSSAAPMFRPVTHIRAQAARQDASRSSVLVR